MEIKLTNQTQLTTTINGKRYDAQRVIKEFCKTKNKGGSYYVDTATCIDYDEEYLVISNIAGEFTRLTR